MCEVRCTHCFTESRN